MAEHKSFIVPKDNSTYKPGAFPEFIPCEWTCKCPPDKFHDIEGYEGKTTIMFYRGIITYNIVCPNIRWDARNPFEITITIKVTNNGLIFNSRHYICIKIQSGTDQTMSSIALPFKVIDMKSLHYTSYIVMDGEQSKCMSGCNGVLILAEDDPA